jgi:Glycosyl transferase family 2
MTLPRITIVTPSFNQGEFIRQTIQSVIDQGYPDIEHIVVDGGSTDDTVPILQEYPHLLWSSEPDRGQSHAINKGFAQATGDIVTWLNSDDWLAPGALHAVAEALSTKEIVMGAVEVTDRTGARKEVQENPTRSWFDLLRYWVYYASPAQPGVFLRRTLLNRCRLPDGTFVDETLHFSMDLDLWLRAGRLAGLGTRIPNVVAHARTYETAKTGQDTDLMYREMSRVFRRHERLVGMSERSVSVMMMLDGDHSPAEQLAEKLAGGRAMDLELLCVDYSRDHRSARIVHRGVLDLCRKYKQLTVRYARSPAGDILNSISHGISVAAAPIVIALNPDATVSSEQIDIMRQLFEQDSLSVVLAGDRDLPQLPTPLRLPEIIGMAHSPLFAFAVRKAAWLDAMGLFEANQKPPFPCDPLIAFTRMRQRGWLLIGADRRWLPACGAAWGRTSSTTLTPANRLEAELLITSHDCLDESEFARVRAKNGFSEAVPPELYDAATKQLSSNAGGDR